jgi:DNA (cytosine-5)-methyltransferase 1
MIFNTFAHLVDLNLMTEKYEPTYKWYLKDLEKVEKRNIKVFSCFACGGGSTMGYKLAGFDVIGANEIDPEMAWHYKTNHNPKHFYLEDIRKFKERNDLPKELFNLDILDGSPPCSSFSMAGAREKGWGKKKVFREGQASQTLDDLFFDFIDLARKLQPKVVIAENVKGLIQGNAKGYVKKIISLFNVSGYDVQLFLLNAATMGVPQKRERVFFICKRKDLNWLPIKIGFHEKTISVKQAIGDIFDPDDYQELRPSLAKYWNKIPIGKSVATVNASGSGFCRIKCNPNDAHPTINADLPSMHWMKPRHLGTAEVSRLSSFPHDYIFKNHKM